MARLVQRRTAEDKHSFGQSTYSSQPTMPIAVHEVVKDISGRQAQRIVRELLLTGGMCLWVGSLNPNGGPYHNSIRKSYMESFVIATE